MKINLKLLRAIALLIISSSTILSAQHVKHEKLFSFEEKEVSHFFTAKNGSLFLSDRHYKDGSQSLCWNFQPNGELVLSKDLLFESKDTTGKDTYLSAFIVWIYNEKAQDKNIDFQFMKDGVLCSSFPFNINFTGWRGAWVCYERDMQGKPQEGMNEVRVIAPDVSGQLFIDHLIPSSKVDSRQQAPDYQIPFVNANTKNHWLVIYKHSLMQPEIKLATSLTKKQVDDMALIEQRYRSELYKPTILTDKRITDIRNHFDKYRIVYNDGLVSGEPIYFCRQAEAYERMIPNWSKDMFINAGVEMRDYFDLMKKVAIAYQDAANNVELRKEMRDKFIAMYDHITDQGVIYGSCWGNIHHYGYSLRGIYSAYFLMKDVLREEGKLIDAEKTLRWYAITNEIYPKPLINGIDMDSFNVQAPGRLASILIMEDSPEKLQYLQSFSRWLDYGCRPALGLSGAFKADGGAHHHRNNYPAYAIGGLGGATQMIKVLSRTEFALSEKAHSTVKNVLKTMRFYCNKLNFPLSMSGRHPDGRGKLVPMQYANMAFAGTPDGKNRYDEDMASAFLRLIDTDNQVENEPEYVPYFSKKEEREVANILRSKGFIAEDQPTGNLSLPSGCVSVQRRDNWAAVVRGHSRYLWAAEHYLGANLFGRYLAHGSMQVLSSIDNAFVTLATSGWQQDGFDWNRIPGTTTIHLPYDQLKAKVYNVDKFSGKEEMLYSDEAFAGGLSQKAENGNFGMILHEHDKYNGTHRARKSYHFFDDRIVCLGSDIENDNSDYPTETTLFQLAMLNDSNRDYWENYQENHNYYIDHLEIGYYTPTAVKLQKNYGQKSRRQNNGKPTIGDWVSLIVEHGKAPKNEKYEYMVWPNCGYEKLEKFAKKPSYAVIQQDRNAHIVHDKSTNTTSYVLFETPRFNIAGKGELLKADTACLAMIKVLKDRLQLTVAQPDLAFYSGHSDEAFDENGKRIERSIYSRPWISNDSGVIPVTITLRGKWRLSSSCNCEVLESNKKETTLRFMCKGGVSHDVELIKDKF